jgi:hypothetical protein
LLSKFSDSLIFSLLGWEGYQLRHVPVIQFEWHKATQAVNTGVECEFHKWSSPFLVFLVRVYR